MVYAVNHSKKIGVDVMVKDSRRQVVVRLDKGNVTDVVSAGSRVKLQDNG